MHKAKCAGMEGLTRTNVEAIVYKLLVFGKVSALQYFVSSIALVIEEDVADVLHVHTYLVRASRLQPALYEGDITEALKDAIMSHCMLSMITFRKDKL